MEDLETYHWKVLATDEYGAVTESEVGEFSTDNTNPVPMWVGGRVWHRPSEEEDIVPIANAAVNISSISDKIRSAITNLRGYYFFQISETIGDDVAEAVIEAKKTSHETVSEAEDLRISLEKSNNVCVDIVNSYPDGDINGDGEPDFGDIIAKLEDRCPDSTVILDIEMNPLCGDISGDGITDMKDALWVLKAMVGEAPEIGPKSVLEGKIGLDDVICLLQMLSEQ